MAIKDINSLNSFIGATGGGAAPTLYNSIHEARSASAGEPVQVVQVADASVSAPAIDWTAIADGAGGFDRDPMTERWLLGKIDPSPGLAGSGRTLILHSATLASLTMNPDFTATLTWSSGEASPRHLLLFPTVSLEVDFPLLQPLSMDMVTTGIYTPTGVDTDGYIVGHCDPATGGNWHGGLNSLGPNVGGGAYLAQQYLGGANDGSTFVTSASFTGAPVRHKLEMPVVTNTHTLQKQVVVVNTVSDVISGPYLTNWRTEAKNMFVALWKSAGANSFSITFRTIGGRLQHYDQLHGGDP